MKNYKSFISSHLFENLEESQIKGLTECEDAKIVVREGGANWNEITQSIDFNGNLKVTNKFTGKSLLELPFSIGVVKGNFTCFGVDSLESLEGSPSFCEDFDASRCSLKSLNGSPEICSNFHAYENLLRNIKGCPKYIFGDFNLSDNMIKSLDFGPLLITGSCKFIGNAVITTTPEGQSENDAKKFSKMHREIAYENLIISADQKEGFKNTIKQIEKSIADRSYVLNRTMEDPENKKFLGNFQEQADSFNYVKKAKDVGLF